MTDSGIEIAKHLDIYDSDFSEDPHAAFRELRNVCPVGKSEELDGYWIVTRYEDVMAAAQDPLTFSSRSITIPRDLAGEGLAERPPLTLDPPRHSAFRRLLLPAFSPKQALRLETTTRQLAREAIAGFVDKEGCDASLDYARKIPVGVMSAVLNLPMDMEPQFFKWANDIFESTDEEASKKAVGDMSDFLDKEIADRIEHPREDIISLLVSGEVDGDRLTHNELLGAISLVLIAGLDTVWSVLGNTLMYLAQNPDDRHRLIRDSTLMNSAVEEFLRYFAPASLARVTTRSTQIANVEVEEDATVLLAFPSANRDPSVFPDAEKVVLDRGRNPHLAFGAGPHRCLGLHVARLELKVGIAEWLNAIPEFELENANAIEFSIGQVWGPRSVPVRFL